jgi:uncharacterized small protein (DUF1192 family)
LRIIKSEKGSITIFQSIIILVIIVFLFVVLDIIRIYYGRAKINSDIELAVDSLMASYDEYMMGEYEVFAINNRTLESSGRTLFYKYLKQNTEGNKSIIYNTGLKKKDIEISGIRNILSSNDNDPLKEQIIKTMKYKAPLKLMEGLFEKITGSSIFEKASIAKNSNEASKKGNRIFETVKKVNKIIDDNNKSIKKLKKEKIKAGSMEKDIKDLKDYTIEFKSVLLRINNLESEIDDYIDEIDSINKDIEKLGETANSINQEFTDYRNKIAMLKNEIDTNIKNTETLCSELTAISNSVQYYQDNISSLEDEKDRLKDDKNNKEKEKDSYISQKESLVLENDLLKLEKEILEALETLTEIEFKRLDEIIETIKENETEILELEEKIPIVEAEIEALEASIKDKEDKIYRYEQKISNEIYTSNNKLSNAAISYPEHLKIERAKVDESQRPDKEEKKEKDNILKNFTEEIKEIFEGKEIPEKWYLSDDVFEGIDKAEKIRNENISDEVFGYDEKDAKKVEEEIEEKTNILLDLTNIIKSGGDDILERIYIIEYIIDKFSYHTSLSDREHYFKKGEVEFIIVGGMNEVDNINTMFLNIGLLRTAINTVDYFIKSKVPSLLYRFIFALAQGIIQSVIDVIELSSGDTIPVCPSMKSSSKIDMELSYSDHLRLFMLLKKDKELLRSIKRLMHINIQNSSDLKNDLLPDYTTGIDIKVKMSINLWILDKLYKLGIGKKYFDEEGYIFEKRIFRYY